MAAINADPAVMEFFPSIQDHEQTKAFISRMQQLFEEKGYCYFAVDTLHNGSLIGFIGIAYQTYEAPFTPYTDIGWRLCKEAWGNGYATEGAKACMEYAFGKCGLAKLYAIAPIINVRSIRIMQKLGMKEVMHFAHPLLQHDARLRECVLYEVEKP
ncbi:GNAT family N-acetyltransferase [Nemorincola caseinilytica]|uniref:GNAT family N-acetyltransferase n=2 Tax=Nemorincola caseinilytica TaxID=2054315 RepID=A0ABP8NEB9_9BACT